MTSHSPEPAIEIRHLHKAYGEQVVLDGIDLTVRAGETLALVGGNGVGKSTLIKLILDFITPDAGQISLFGQPHTLPASRAPLAYLPERFVPPAWMKAGTYLRTFLKLYGAPWDPERVHHLCEMLHFDPAHLNTRVTRLSKGMTQKIGLMSVFLSNKPLLILDEPMSGLDPLARIGVKQAIQALKDNGTTLLYSSHMLPDVEVLCDRLAILHDRQFRFVGTVAACLTRTGAEHLEEAYLRIVTDHRPDPSSGQSSWQAAA